ncbi:MAG: efflux RND transporter periplasmic adaptor subunit [Desulfomonilaceae bacterium]
MARKSINLSGKAVMRFLKLCFLGMALPVAAVAIIWAGQHSHYERSEAAREAILKAGPRVQVVSATPGTPTESVKLTGQAWPYLDVTLYSKVSGYLKDIKVDKGDKVSSGEFIAEVESPELDQKYEAAVADAKDKRIDADHAKALIKSGSISDQDLEHKISAAEVAESKAGALKTEKDYQYIRAPFAGTVTARYVDPGALLQGSVQRETRTMPIVRLAEDDRLRVYIYCDQNIAGMVRLGDPAEIWDPARPAVKIKGEVNRISGEIDPKTRTMMVEIDLNNRDMQLVPGTFVQVSLSVHVPPTVVVPVEALVIRGDKYFVPVIGNDNRVNFRPVTVYDTNGATVRISSGLKVGERVGLYIGDSVADGHLVRPVTERLAALLKPVPVSACG